jgi:ABC-2 type transport system permease protein
MSTMVALIRREWQEHQVGLGWSPVAILAVLALITFMALATSTVGGVNVSVEGSEGSHSFHEEVEISSLSALAQFMELDRWSDAELEENLAKFRSLVAMPFKAVYFLIAVFVLISALHDDRRDRSVLFWKSMPVSDAETVLSKLVTVVWVAPVVVIAGIVAAQLFLLIVISTLTLVEDVGGAGRLWWHSGLLTGTVELVVGYVIQGFWALPLYAWLLAVSAAAPRLPILWAVLLPGLPAIAERMVLGTHGVSDFVRAHLEFAALPAAASEDDGIIQPAVGLAEQLSLVFSFQMWLGVVVGGLLLWLAVYLRNRNNDL